MWRRLHPSVLWWLSDVVFALDFYLRPVVFGQQKAPKEVGGVGGG